MLSRCNGSLTGSARSNAVVAFSVPATKRDQKTVDKKSRVSTPSLSFAAAAASTEAPSAVAAAPADADHETKELSSEIDAVMTEPAESRPLGRRPELSTPPVQVPPTKLRPEAKSFVPARARDLVEVVETSGAASTEATSNVTSTRSASDGDGTVSVFDGASNEPHGGSSPSDSWRRQLRREAENAVVLEDICVLCQKETSYNSSVFLSSCLHAMCDSCATQALATSDNSELFCGICQLATPVPERKLSLLPPHPLRQVDLALGPGLLCSECEDAGHQKCVTCSLILCKDHAELHERKYKGAAVAHRLLPLLPQVCCFYHRALVAEAICNTCNRYLCKGCVLAHAGLTDAAHKQQAEVANLTADVVEAKALASVTAAVEMGRDSTEALMDKLMYLRELQETVRRRNDDVKRRINEVFEALMLALTKRQNELLEELDKFSTVESQSWLELDDAVRVQLASASTTVVMSRRVQDISRRAPPSAAAWLLEHMQQALRDRAAAVAARVQQLALTRTVPAKVLVNVDGNFDQVIARFGAIAPAVDEASASGDAKAGATATVEG